MLELKKFNRVEKFSYQVNNFFFSADKRRNIFAFRNFAKRLRILNSTAYYYNRASDTRASTLHFSRTKFNSIIRTDFNLCTEIYVVLQSVYSPFIILAFAKTRRRSRIPRTQGIRHKLRYANRGALTTD
jgi:hypothetical protein